MAQFLANLVQAWYCERFSPYPRFLSTLLFWYMISLLVLFGTFYYNKHIRGSSRVARKKEQ
jgi:elongation of very long chain fatty acids protein 4